MRKILLLSILITLLALFLNCGGSKNDADKGGDKPDLSAADTSGTSLLDELSKDNIDEMYDQLVLGAAQDFTLYDLNGTKYTLADFKDYVFILHFWSMETALSKRLFPLLSEVQNMYSDSGFAVLGVLMDNKQITAIRDYADFNKISFTIVYPQSQAIYQNYGVTAPGMSFLIDRKGNVVGQFFGDPGREKLIRIINLFL